MSALREWLEVGSSTIIICACFISAAVMLMIGLFALCDALSRRHGHVPPPCVQPAHTNLCQTLKGTMRAPEVCWCAVEA